MLRRDYLIRLINEIIRTLTDAVGLTKAERYDEALVLLDEAYQQLLGWKADFVSAMPDEHLVGMMTLGGVLDVDRCLFLANLLKAEGDVYAAKGEAGHALHRHTKALNLALTALTHDPPPTLPADFNVVPALLDTLADEELPLAIHQTLWRYHERQGDYAKAEDALYHLRDAAPDDEATAQAGHAFYRRLLARSDDALVAGGLSREEAEDGLREWGD